VIGVDEPENYCYDIDKISAQLNLDNQEK